MMEENQINNSKSGVYRKPSQLKVLFYLVKRHFMVFFNDKLLMLFSLMVPLVVLGIYIIFLRPMEVSQLDLQIESGLGFKFDAATATAEATDLVHKIRGVVDEWMISGILSVSCITVALNTENIMISDKESGVTKDFLSSPINASTVTISYTVFNVAITFFVNFIVYLICLIYLGAYGAILPGALDGLAIVGIILLSTISASLALHYICAFINKVSVLSSITAIVSAAIGFLCGAYLPASMMPTYVQYITMFFPGSYSSGLFRNYFMRTPIEELETALINATKGDTPLISKSTEEITAFIETVEGSFSLDLNFFGHVVPVSTMALVILAFIGIFLVLDLFFTPSAIDRFFKRQSANFKKDSRALGKKEPIIPMDMMEQHDDELVTDDEIIKVDDSVKNVPSSKDNFPFGDGDKHTSSTGHIVDDDK